MMNVIPVQHTLATPYLVGSVHCYSTLIDDELVLFDTGPPTDEAKNQLRSALDLTRLRHVIISHCHIDHYGLARWLEQETDAVVYLPFRDSLKIRQHERRLHLMYGLLTEVGFDDAFLRRFEANMNDGTVFPPLPQRFRIIEEDLPSHLGITALPCPGHSQSDLVLIGNGWAVTGDVLLKGIFQSPLLDVDLLTGQRFRNYDAYCQTLLKLATLRDKQILPGHRHTIDSVDANILFYLSKLLQRAVRCRNLDPQRPLSEVAINLLGQLQQHPFAVYLKVSELVFIRDFLDKPQQLRRALEDIGLFEPVAKLYQDAVAI